MRKSIWLDIVSLLLVSISLLTPVLAEDTVKKLNITVIPRAVIGVMEYQFEYTYAQPNVKPSQIKLSDGLPFLGAGMVVAYDNYLVDLYFQRTDTGEDGGSVEKDSESVRDVANTEFDRQDYSVTLGYSLPWVTGLSAFAGYKGSKTKFDLKSTINYMYERVDETKIGSAEFKSNGPFIGASYRLPLGQGYLGANLAVGRLKGDYDQHSRTDRYSRAMGEALDPQNDIWSISGHTIGFALGINWSASLLTERLRYTLQISGFRYDFDKDEASLMRDGRFILIPGNVGYDFKEQMLSGQLSISYRFDL